MTRPYVCTRQHVCAQAHAYGAYGERTAFCVLHTLKHLSQSTEMDPTHFFLSSLRSLPFAGLPLCRSELCLLHHCGAGSKLWEVFRSSGRAECVHLTATCSPSPCLLNVVTASKTRTAPTKQHRSTDDGDRR